MPRRRLLLLTIALAGLLAGTHAIRRVERPPLPGTPDAALSGSTRRHAARAATVVAGMPAAVSAPAPRPRVVPGRSIVLAHLPPRAGDPGRIAVELLEEHRSALGLDAMPGELVPERAFDSLSGHHVRWVQTLGGVRVFGSRVASHVAPDGRPLLVQADVYPLRGLADAPEDLVPEVAAGEAAAEAAALVADEGGAGRGPAPRISSAPELVILPVGRGGRLAWHIGVRAPDETLRVFVDARDGGVLRADDARVAADGRGMVFRPNPIHSSGNSTLRDQDDREQAALTTAMELVTLPRLDGTGYLRGQWADLRDSPVSTFSSTLDWSWVSRSHHAFEQVNAYYHVDRVQARLQELGLDGVNAEAQRVDAHATTQDQSIYDIFDDRLEFGDGGVDDAEDGDVVIHEYGHAIQFDQIGTFGVTDEGGAMGEGFGDFLAVLFHESGRPAWDPLFASWDATSLVNRDPPYLRRVDRDKVYPDDYVDQVHTDGEIWSRFLMDLRDLIGADDALRVVVESHFFLTQNARFKNGCEAIIVANIALREGRDDASIRLLMDLRGLPHSLPPAPLPDEEPFEADDVAGAATLAPGVYGRLLLADDDYVKVVVPPFRRYVVRIEHDPVAFDLDAAALDTGGRLAALSEQPGGLEELSLTAGAAPVTYALHLYHADDVVPGAYDLSVTETELEAFGPVQTVVRKLEPGETWAFRVSVAPAKVEEGAQLKIVTRRPRRGAKTDLQLHSPDGTEVVDVTAARKKKGAKAVVDVDAFGDWVGVVRPREDQRGPVKLKIKLR